MNGFQPIVPLSGYAGWAFLGRTLESQQEAHDKSPVLQREVAYFEKNIGNIKTAEDLVADRTMLKVALGAFGLGEDIGNTYFLRKVLEDGTIDPGALANRLSDKRYLEFSKAFGFGDFSVANTQLSDFAGGITTAYKERQFEVAIGEQDENMRLALGLRRELDSLVARDISDNAMWFTVMGNAPLRAVFEAALGLPTAFGALDLDKQLSVFKDRAQSQFGDSAVAQFSDPEKQEDLIRMFLFRSELQTRSSMFQSSQTALTLLQNRIRPYARL
ncbi:MAG: DUF1217 domain-containing protein [Halocynthiibacter sp.]